MAWSLERVGDSALVLAFEERIDPVINDRAVRVASAIREVGRQGVRDVVDSYAAVTVHFDPVRTDVTALARDLEREARAMGGAAVDVVRRSREVLIPVCYGGARGPDLSDVAAFGRCSEAAVIERHAARVYRVYMLGFLPGFAYLADVDRTIAAPRRVTARLRVPAGSVGIAGGQTGVYPVEAPGGWQLVGQTPTRMHTPERADPFLLHAGDAVRFTPIDETAFHRLDAGSGGPAVLA